MIRNMASGFIRVAASSGVNASVLVLAQHATAGVRQQVGFSNEHAALHYADYQRQAAAQLFLMAPDIWEL